MKCQMRLCISNIAWGVDHDDEMYQICQNMGYSGIEIAPTRIFPENPYEHIREAKIWASGLNEEYDIDVISIQSFWYGRKEHIFGGEKERQQLIEYSKKAFCFAKAVGAGIVVFGCPKNRDGFTKDMVYNCKVAMDFFGKLAEIASECQVTVALEPNPDIYGTDFLNTLDQTVRFIENIGLQSLRLNLDFGAMIYNNENFTLLRGKENLIAHVHISEPGLLRIKEREGHAQLSDFLNGFEYKKAVSVEMGRQENTDVVYQTMKYVHDVFKVNAGCS